MKVRVMPEFSLTCRFVYLLCACAVVCIGALLRHHKRSVGKKGAAWAAARYIPDMCGIVRGFAGSRGTVPQRLDGLMMISLALAGGVCHRCMCLHCKRVKARQIRYRDVNPQRIFLTSSPAPTPSSFFHHPRRRSHQYLRAHEFQNP